MAEQKDKLVGGPHDLSDHPAQELGTLKNMGDYRGAAEQRGGRANPVVVEQTTSKGSTNTSDTKKSSRKSGEGAGPES